MQLRQFLKYFYENTDIKIITTVGEGNDKKDVVLYAGTVFGIFSTSQFFNSILDTNIKENSVVWFSKVATIYV